MKYYLHPLILWIVLAGLFLEAQESTRPGFVCFVATNGNDANNGTKEMPFASLEGARDFLRQLRKNGDPRLENGVTIEVRGGFYRLKSTVVFKGEDGGSERAPVVYRASEGEKVYLSGGDLIPAKAFKPASDDFKKSVADFFARRFLLQVDLKSLGISDYGKIQPRYAVDFGSPSLYKVAQMELFVDGRRMILSRWPNKNERMPLLGQVDGARVVFDPKETGEAAKNKKSYSGILYGSASLRDVKNLDEGDIPGLAPIHAKQRMGYWKNMEDIWVGGAMIRCYSYVQRKIASVDPKEGKITLETPIVVWEGWNQKAITQTFFFNLPEETDTPGEYYINRKSGVLYFYPPQGWSENSHVVLSQMEDALISLEGVSHLRFKNLTMEGTRASVVAMSGGEDNVLEGCEIRCAGLVGVQIGEGYDSQKRSLIKRFPGDYRHMLCTGMESSPVIFGEAHAVMDHPRGGTELNRNGGKKNGLVRCRVHDTGCGGVLLGGGDRKKLEPAGNFVMNSEIFNTDGVVSLYAEGVVIDGVGNLVSGNYLHDSKGGILYIHGNDHVIEYNEIAHAVKESADCGALEIRQNPSQLGNKIRFNYIHDIASGRWNSPCYAIYLDNETHGVEVSGNVFARIRGRSVDPFGRLVIAVNGGHLHQIFNNVFVDCDGGNVGDGHEYEKTFSIFKSREFMYKRDVDVFAEPYASKYPRFVEILKGDKNVLLYNDVYSNMLVGCGATVGPGRYPDKNFHRDNVVFEEDPGFKNLLQDDFELLPNSPAFQKIPGFRPIPFEKMQHAKEWMPFHQ